MTTLKQKVKKLEKAIQEKEPEEFVTIMGLVDAESEEELQKRLEILRKKPLHRRERPIDYEKYFNE